MRRFHLKEGILPPDWCPRAVPPRRELQGTGVRVLPLRGYRYDEARPLVVAGQRVSAGEPLSEPCGLLSRVRLAPASGRILAVENRRVGDGCLLPCAVLQVEQEDEQPLSAGLALSAQGLENLDGIPLDHELAILPAGAILILNAAETELGHWTLMARLEELARGKALSCALDLVLERARFQHLHLAHRAPQRKAAEALVAALKPGISLTRIQLDNSHPGAHPRLLAERATRLVNPSRTLDPTRLLAGQGVLVLDLDRLLLLERRLTVGPADHFLLSVSDLAGNGELVELPSGLPWQELFPEGPPSAAFAGGALDGKLLRDTDSPLCPPLRALVTANPEELPRLREDACNTCGRCLEACPRSLAPPRLVHLIEEQRLHEARGMGLEHCLLCGVCSYVCPSHIHLGHSLRKGLQQLREVRHV
ncbi:MAG: 4Fe-4S dicluster domain-containing protein [Candidatus Delongbacteria bacterium]|nr:4Fe-4S dicluster domain-containing protein [Candidatus Delongbacteria bacterium]